MVGRQLGMGDEMKFLEAYQWMNENPENICLRNGDLEYKVDNGMLLVKDLSNWDGSCIPFGSLSNSTWQKVGKKKIVVLHEALFYDENDDDYELQFVSKNYVLSREGCSIVKWTGKKREFEL